VKIIELLTKFALHAALKIKWFLHINLGVIEKNRCHLSPYHDTIYGLNPYVYVETKMHLCLQS